MNDPQWRYQAYVANFTHEGEEVESRLPPEVSEFTSWGNLASCWDTVQKCLPFASTFTYAVILTRVRAPGLLKEGGYNEDLG